MEIGNFIKYNPFYYYKSSGNCDLCYIFALIVGGVCLLHTTRGQLLRRFEAPQTAVDRLRPCGGVAIAASVFGGTSPRRVVVTRHGYVVFQLGATRLAVFTLNARLVSATDLHRQVRYLTLFFVFSSLVF